VHQPLLDCPAPDFEALECVLMGAGAPERVHIVELHIDQEVLQAIAEQYLGEGWAGWDRASGALPSDVYLQQVVTIYHRLGYDCVPAPTVWTNHPPRDWQRTSDTAGLSRGEREWASEGRGLITSWEEMERFPWERIRAGPEICQRMARHLPEGMKLTVMAPLFEHILETLLGYEGLFYAIHDDPELVAEVFARWGEVVHDYYDGVIGLDAVGAIFHADDLGFTTSTFVPPAFLRRQVFPWLKAYAALAHRQGKGFWYHCCGNVYRSGIIEDLIEDVDIDAFHSFQDTILPVVDFKARYGHRVAVLGGPEMDKLARMSTGKLRRHVRDILERCVPGRRFALSSGNTIANYIPLRNYLAMLEEARRWGN
jgi:uroporphyrinogen decarboxylase